MTKFFERSKAVRLRKEGRSYSEIKEKIRVSKSSLSLWLRDVPLTEKQILSLKKNKEKAVEKFRITMRLKREERLNNYYNQQRKTWLPLTDREEFIAGLFLYWGEGGKANRNTISINNTDPAVVKFARYWIANSLNIPLAKIKVQIHLYKDMQINKELSYWEGELGIPKTQFLKPYIKESNRTSLDQKGFGHGTCGLIVHNTVLKENVLMAIKAISENYTKNRMI